MGYGAQLLAVRVSARLEAVGCLVSWRDVWRVRFHQVWWWGFCSASTTSSWWLWLGWQANPIETFPWCSGLVPGCGVGVASLPAGVVVVGGVSKVGFRQRTGSCRFLAHHLAAGIQLTNFPRDKKRGCIRRSFDLLIQPLFWKWVAAVSYSPTPWRVQYHRRVQA